MLGARRGVFNVTTTTGEEVSQQKAFIAWKPCKKMLHLQDLSICNSSWVRDADNTYILQVIWFWPRLWLYVNTSNRFTAPALYVIHCVKTIGKWKIFDQLPKWYRVNILFLIFRFKEWQVVTFMLNIKPRKYNVAFPFKQFVTYTKALLLFLTTIFYITFNSLQVDIFHCISPTF